MSWVDLGPADLADGALRDAHAGGVHLGLARLGVDYVAFDVWCTHAGCPLTDGWLERRALRCACHGALFELPSGSVLEPPATEPLAIFETRVVGERVEAFVPLPGMS
jgi:3-phenylpropionate/trans-cinnamate dioxygenase ferredoxin subunit